MKLHDIYFVGKRTDSLDQSHFHGHKSPVKEMHNDLDEALAKLQQILANNVTLDGRCK